MPTLAQRYRDKAAPDGYTWIRIGDALGNDPNPEPGVYVNVDRLVLVKVVR